ncbi:nucleotidyltransferase [Nocardia sp. BSTN01]|uniref:nucleotidyltransferase n=1 Tax=Nocardia sp. BSTN01 TaxID=2783665 RepID=UPI00188DF6E7|nr:nucleotidyltransferase [Nocardia sp. BSTN01]MBF4996656.1 nucleotidyltransferase [Nocardia sp. BSTN01]
MTALEDKLGRYCQPSSDHEQAKQDRAERMVRNAVEIWKVDHEDVRISYVPKGSYANNTNVRQDSDVDIAVVRTDFYYFDTSELRESDKQTGSGQTFPLEGVAFRNSLAQSLKVRFGSDCDTTGSTAIELIENSGRVSADIVPSFDFRKYYYDVHGRIAYHSGQKVFKTDGTSVVNYPLQQLENGRAKNNATSRRYKKLVRILKRAENDLVAAGRIKELPSYFMECLMYRVPNDHFNHLSDTPLTDDLTSATAYIWSATQEGGDALGWLEPNEIKPLFGSGQKWTMAEANTLMLEVWRLFDLKAGSN